MLARRKPASTARLKICRFCGSSADLHTNRTDHRSDKQSSRAAGGGGVDLQAIVSNGVAAASYLSSFVYRPQPTLTSSAAVSAAKENLSKRLAPRSYATYPTGKCTNMQQSPTVCGAQAEGHWA